MPHDSVEALIEPHSVAVIGASPRQGSIGFATLQNVLAGGRLQAVYPVNMKESQIMGLKAYRNVRDIPGPVDLALMCVNAAVVPQALEDCEVKGVKAAIVFASGFGETGGEGARLNEQVQAIVNRGRLRVLGPNCLGAYNASLGLNLTMSATFGELSAEIQPGNLGFISQSGSYGMGLFMWGLAQGVHFSKFFSMGNKIDVDEVDFLNYLSQDTATRVIIMYLEEVRDGRRFLQAARPVASEKPLVAFKVGRTAAGARAASSHTGAMAGSYEVYKAAFKQAGIILVEKSRDLLDVGKTLSMQPPLSGQRVGVLTVSGAQGVELCDALEGVGLKVPELSSPLQERLIREGACPSYGSPRNPVDFTAPGPETARWFYESARIVLQSGEVDGLILTMIGGALRYAAPTIVSAAEELKSYGKPIIVTALAPKSVMGLLVNELQVASFPVFEDCTAAVKGMAALYQYGCLKRGAAGNG